MNVARTVAGEKHLLLLAHVSQDMGTRERSADCESVHIRDLARLLEVDAFPHHRVDDLPELGRHLVGSDFTLRWRPRDCCVGHVRDD
jgi:hypothetical protein